MGNIFPVKRSILKSSATEQHVIYYMLGTFVAFNDGFSDARHPWQGLVGYSGFFMR